MPINTIIVKNSIAQSADRGISSTAAGYTTNASPGPIQPAVIIGRSHTTTDTTVHLSFVVLCGVMYLNFLTVGPI